MRLRYHVEYGSLVALAALVRALPRPTALRLGAAIGELGWLLRIRRRLVLANLAQALPSLAPSERRRLGARASRNFGRTVAEFVRFAGADRARVGELVALAGLDRLRAALAEGRGAIVVTAHLGSWALYVTALAAAGIPSALLVGKQHNPKVDAFILGIPGDAVRFISKGRAAPRDILRSLQEGRAVVMVADQSAGRRGVLAPFLGRVASTLALPGAFGARYGTPIFILLGRRASALHHEVEIARLPYSRDGGEEAVREAITSACNHALGEGILRHPEHYFWYHRRWRDRAIRLGSA